MVFYKYFAFKNSGFSLICGEIVHELVIGKIEVMIIEWNYFAIWMLVL
jgi:hypothetical protein